ncbi:phosphoribosylglycinamide formyltransferase [Sapientia aquatica]|uniref:Phosphoribosylglycinamide formyltransferase n=1 Tax=Sapientia aquatica TaxID=1549640 RepID=A0A4R5VWH0_9BURK|nr:phosphoribosylglycinamide formyltransferase [Sapientia aquatica]TDK63599.1 phosphoribosylglycinamide formyltransferase [Sapientia aquatica]
MKNIVILISGRGSNMQAIVAAATSQHWDARITAVISNRQEAEGLAFAEQQGIPTAVVSNKQYSTRSEFDAALQAQIDQFAPDLVVLAGFMRILTPEFVQHYAGRMINIHPSLLPNFTGLHTHRQALQAAVSEHGATVHVVTPELDHGPILGQARIPVIAGDNEESLAARVLEQEHVLYPSVIKQIIDGTINLRDQH